MRPTTLAIIAFVLIEILLFGSAAYCLCMGHWVAAVVPLLLAVMVRIRAVNDGPNGDGAMVILSLLHRKYLSGRKLGK